MFAFAFDTEALETVDAPVQIWSGSLDERVPHASNGGVLAAALHGKSDVEIVENAGHFASLTPCNPALETSGSQTWQMVCVDAPGFDRVAFHVEMNTRIVGFFDSALLQ